MSMSIKSLTTTGRGYPQEVTMRLKKRVTGEPTGSTVCLYVTLAKSGESIVTKIDINEGFNTDYVIPLDYDTWTTGVGSFSIKAGWQIVHAYFYYQIHGGIAGDTMGAAEVTSADFIGLAGGLNQKYVISFSGTNGGTVVRGTPTTIEKARMVTPGLYSMGARLYDPQLGMFLSPDPLEQYADAYSYTGGNPVNFVDPTGAYASSYEIEQNQQEQIAIQQMYEDQARMAQFYADMGAGIEAGHQELMMQRYGNTFGRGLGDWLVANGYGSAGTRFAAGRSTYNILASIERDMQWGAEANSWTGVAAANIASGIIASALYTPTFDFATQVMMASAASISIGGSGGAGYTYGMPSEMMSLSTGYGVSTSFGYSGNAPSSGISASGLSFIAGWEGFGSTPYNDVAGNPTIGFGHLIQSGESFSSLSRAQGMALLQTDVGRFERTVSGAVHVGPALQQYQYDALVSFAYNIGGGAFRSSSVLRNVNAGNFSGAAAAFSSWNRAGGQISAGLSARRAAEADLFLNGY
jgi:lysozyme